MKKDLEKTYEDLIRRIEEAEKSLEELMSFCQSVWILDEPHDEYDAMEDEVVYISGGVGDVEVDDE